jgi:hypothetical protein
MKCFVCEGDLKAYFSKYFNYHDLGNVEYWQCEKCGLVTSKTHAEMSTQAWESLNNQYHESYHGTDSCPDDKNWIWRLRCQAKTINELVTIGILPTRLSWVDYGCGDGKLADMLSENKRLRIRKFDKYANKANSLLYEDLIRQKFSVVINCSVIEHVLSLQPLQEIINLVADDGVFAVHTLVREEIPRDPDWFYLLPVHCSFYTNKSMQILFEKFGFKASIYHVDSRMWFWFKNNEEGIHQILQKESVRLHGELHFKFGFVDYWR